MYLDKSKKIKGVPFKVLDLLDCDTLKKENKKVYNVFKEAIVSRGSGTYKWDDFFEEVGYWRKANEIHNWFVEKIQDGEDKCERHHVSKEVINGLLEDCIHVLGSLERSKTDNDGIYLDTDIAEKFLPTTQGFFFGGTNYDKYYKEDLEYTKNLCEDILRDFDFENYDLSYVSSW